MKNDHVICGAEVYSDWREKDKKVDQIRKEFEGQVKIVVGDNIIQYQHFSKQSVFNL